MEDGSGTSIPISHFSNRIAKCQLEIEMAKFSGNGSFEPCQKSSEPVLNSRHWQKIDNAERSHSWKQVRQMTMEQQTVFG